MNKTAETDNKKLNIRSHSSDSEGSSSSEESDQESSCHSSSSSSSSDSNNKYYNSHSGGDNNSDRKMPANPSTTATARQHPLSSTIDYNDTRQRKASQGSGGLTPDERWDEMYRRLVDFKRKHGHCSVPNRFPEDPSLGCWVSTQRRLYKKAQLKQGEGLLPDRAQRLQALGFEWTGENPRHKNWDVRFEELKEFKKKYGHAQVPIGYAQNVQLANWTSTQRQEYKNLLKGKPSRLNEERIQQLQDIGFAWELQRGGRRRLVSTSRRNTNLNLKNNCTGSERVCDDVVLPGIALLGGNSSSNSRSSSNSIISSNSNLRNTAVAARQPPILVSSSSRTLSQLSGNSSEKSMPAKTAGAAAPDAYTAYCQSSGNATNNNGSIPAVASSMSTAIRSSLNTNHRSRPDSAAVVANMLTQAQQNHRTLSQTRQRFQGNLSGVSDAHLRALLALVQQGNSAGSSAPLGNMPLTGAALNSNQQTLRQSLLNSSSLHQQQSRHVQPTMGTAQYLSSFPTSNILRSAAGISNISSQQQPPLQLLQQQLYLQLLQQTQQQQAQQQQTQLYGGTASGGGYQNNSQLLTSEQLGNVAALLQNQFQGRGTAASLLSTAMSPSFTSAASPQQFGGTNSENKGGGVGGG